jgi:hypothetical protein
MFCLIKPLADAFKEALRKGEIDPAKLADMTTAERRGVFERYMDKDAAKQVNTLFERKLLVKDFQNGMVKWAREVVGLKPEVRRGIIDKIERLTELDEEGNMKPGSERILNPADQKAFLADLAERTIGTEITMEEAQVITRMSKELAETKKKFDVEKKEWTSEADRLKYGFARVEMQNFLDNAKEPYRGLPLKEAAKARIADELANIKDRPIAGGLKLAGNTIVDLADLSVSMVATLDNSFLGRQGLAVLFTHPTVWAKGARQSYTNIVKEFGGKNAMDALRADILSRPNAMLGRYEKSGVINPNEEQYPSSFPEKIPALGRVFKASESAFKGSALRMRADVMDLLIEKGEANGLDMDSKEQLESYGTLVNSLTAKGSFNDPSTGKVLRTVLWAPKMLKASVDVLTAHTADYVQGKITKEAYKEAWLNVFKIVGTTAAILLIIKALKPEAVELNPISSDFGKVKIGNHRIDITGGKAGIITLVARMLSGSTKSTTSGAITEFGPGFGQKSRFDALIDFLTNKVNPPVRVAIDLMKGQTFDGTAPTLLGEITSLYVPLPTKNAKDFVLTPNWENALGFFFDFHGLSSNSYQDSNVKTGLIPEGKNIKDDDFVSMVATYAKALGTDPETAFNRIFTGQKIRRVDNGAIIVERMTVGESEAIKKKANGNNPTMKLDHTVPLELGGSNDESNLKMVTTGKWQSYTPIENYLAKLLKDEKISKKDAQRVIVEFKEEKITADKVRELYH